MLWIYAANDKSGAALTAGTQIPLWSLDEGTGLWKEEGSGTVGGCRYAT